MAQEKRQLSRRTFVAGTCGTAFGLAAGIGGTKCLVDKSMPPETQIPSVPADGFWLESTTSRLTDQIPLKGNHKADVVVVGAGFTGISTAFHLSEAFPNRRILLLEANIAGAGASGKNNGLAIEGMSGIEPIVDEWIAKERVDKAREVWEKASSGIKIIEKLIREHNLDCDWAPVDMLFSPLTPGQEERCMHLRRQHELLDIDSKWLSENTVAQRISIEGFRGALAIPGGAMVHPVKLILSVGKLAKKRGVEVYENTPVMKIEPGSQVKVHLQYGTVQTSALILATNAYTSNLGIFKQRIIPVHSHTIVTAPLTDHQVESLWKGREPIADMASMFVGFHLTADNRVLCAGKDGFYYYGGSIDTEKGHPIYDVLVQSLRNHFPALSDIPVTHHWAGTVGMTLDMVPTIGAIGPRQNIFFGGGYSGHGIGPGFLFGKLLSELYAGEPVDPVFEFALNRKPPWIPPEPFTSAGFALARRYIHWQDEQ